MKLMYKSEIKQLEKLRNSLKSGTKLNGNTVILGEVNQRNLFEAIDSVQIAISYLLEIKSAS